MGACGIEPTASLKDVGDVASEATRGLRDAIDHIKEFHAQTGDARDAELIARLESILFRLWLVADWDRRN